jgi:hypothetical protein
VRATPSERGHRSGLSPHPESLLKGNSQFRLAPRFYPIRVPLRPLDLPINRSLHSGLRGGPKVVVDVTRPARRDVVRPQADLVEVAAPVPIFRSIEDRRRRVGDEEGFRFPVAASAGHQMRISAAAHSSLRTHGERGGSTERPHQNPHLFEELDYHDTSDTSGRPNRTARRCLGALKPGVVVQPSTWRTFVAPGCQPSEGT